MKEILIVDDDQEIRNLVKTYLEIEGYIIKVAANGAEALGALDDDIGLVILDVMMPMMNGFEVAKLIRDKSRAPILFLSATATEQDRFLGYSSGGDEYMSKPFSFAELSLRVRALLRRYYDYGTHDGMIDDSSHIKLGAITLDLKRRIVLKHDEEVELTEREYRIFELLASKRGRIFTVQMIYESVWNDDYYYASANTVMVHIRNLRKKIELNPDSPEIVKNIWGRGYKID